MINYPNEGNSMDRHNSPNATTLEETIKANFAKAEADPDYAAVLESLGLRLYSSSVFIQSQQELEAIFSEYETHHKSEAGVAPKDLTDTAEALTALLDKLKDQVQIKAMSRGDSASEEAVEFLKNIAGATDETGLAHLADLMNEDSAIPAEEVREMVLELRAGVTEVLWEFTGFLKEDAADYPETISKPQQQAIYDEFAHNVEVVKREIADALKDLEGTPIEPSGAIGSEGTET